MIHGIFFVDKLLITALFGIIAGWYYHRERNPLPLMVAHALLDLRSFGLAILDLM
jgi:membrane protease YdiL (CAAX protease family)